jgi:ketosteroid isomerase-like protein
MPSAEPRAIFEAYLRAMNSGDADTLRELLHPDFTETYPQSGELIRGFENVRAEMEGHPGGYLGKGTDRVVGTADRWVVTPANTVLRIEGSGDTFTGVSQVHYSDGSDWYAVMIGEIRDGRVWRVQTFWGPKFEAPAYRSSIVEMIPPAEKTPGQ